MPNTSFSQYNWRNNLKTCKWKFQTPVSRPSAFLHIISLFFIIVFPFFFSNQTSLYDSSEVRPHCRSSHSLTVRNVPAVTRGVFSCYLQKKNGNKAIGPLVKTLIMTDECRRAVRTEGGMYTYKYKYKYTYMCLSSLKTLQEGSCFIIILFS